MYIFCLSKTQLEALKSLNENEGKREKNDGNCDVLMNGAQPGNHLSINNNLASIMNATPTQS